VTGVGRAAWLRTGIEILLAGVLLVVLAYLVDAFPKWPTDVDVYRLGAETFLRGHSIYTQLPVSPEGGPLPYTYPPVSAVVFVPLGLLPASIGFPLLSAVSALALIPLIMAYRKVPELQTLLIKPWMVLAAAVALVLAHPVKNTLFWGQINVILMMLVALDCLSPKPRWPRGVLIGIAAAVKLTPAGFVLLLLLRKDYRAVITSMISFLVMTGIGWVLLPSDSFIYWTNRVFHATDMYIGLPYANESLIASLKKLGMTGMPLTVVSGVGLVAVLVMTWLGTRRAIADGNIALALGVNAAGVLLVSPISWSHHWVLALPTSALLVVMGYQRRNAWLLIAGGLAVAVYWLAPHYEMPIDAAVWTLPEKIAGNTYQALALALLIVMTVRQLANLDGRRPEAAAPPDGPHDDCPEPPADKLPELEPTFLVPPEKLRRSEVPR
jgi:alpha-1,2-mannosyltransferase